MHKDSCETVLHVKIHNMTLIFRSKLYSIVSYNILMYDHVGFDNITVLEISTRVPIAISNRMENLSWVG